MTDMVTNPEVHLHRILIVDDNQLTARSLAKVLESAAYLTAITYRGGDALEYARTKPCMAAILDVHLPDVSGLEVARKMRDIWGPKTPIIVISGDTSMDVIHALSNAGATYFLSKPLNVPHLIERLKEWIVPPLPR